MHTSSTIALLEQCTQALGYYLWKFVRVVCSSHITYELDREVAARNRCKEDGVDKGKNAAQIRTFNLCTVKLHSLGDYPEFIKLHGPSDGMSTQIVSDIV
jgi:hypothetical protein